MDVAFESRFAKDLKRIQDASLRRRVKQLINETQNASSKHEIPNLTKLKGFSSYYRIRIGNYRIGLEIIDTRVIFVRILHRKAIYRYFP